MAELLEKPCFRFFAAGCQSFQMNHFEGDMGEDEKYDRREKYSALQPSFAV